MDSLVDRDMAHMRHSPCVFGESNGYTKDSQDNDDKSRHRHDISLSSFTYGRITTINEV